MERMYHDLMRYIDHMGMSQWMVVLAIVIVVGFFCLRGFGSRT